MDGDVLAAGASKTTQFALKAAFAYCVLFLYGAVIGDGYLGEYLVDHVGHAGYGREFHVTLDTFSRLQADQYEAAFTDVLEQGMDAGSRLSRRAVRCEIPGGVRLRVRAFPLHS